jgi:hypothetical protein
MGMAKGYPSRKRARKAFERGVKTSRTGRGRNPYANDVLKELFDRGLSRGGSLGMTVRPGATVAKLPADAAWDRAVRNSRRRPV